MIRFKEAAFASLVAAVLAAQPALAQDRAPDPKSSGTGTGTGTTPPQQDAPKARPPRSRADGDQPRRHGPPPGVQDDTNTGERRPMGPDGHPPGPGMAPPQGQGQADSTRPPPHRRPPRPDGDTQTQNRQRPPQGQTPGQPPAAPPKGSTNPEN